MSNPRLENNTMTETHNDNKLISDKVIPYLPYGRLLVQKFSDGKMFKIVVTGTDIDGNVIDEMSGSINIEPAAVTCCDSLPSSSSSPASSSSSSVSSSSAVKPSNEVAGCCCKNADNNNDNAALTMLQTTLEHDIMKKLELNNN